MSYFILSWRKFKLYIIWTTTLALLFIVSVLSYKVGGEPFPTFVFYSFLLTVVLCMIVLEFWFIASLFVSIINYLLNKISAYKGFWFLILTFLAFFVGAIGVGVIIDLLFIAYFSIFPELNPKVYSTTIHWVIIAAVALSQYVILKLYHERNFISENKLRRYIYVATLIAATISIFDEGYWWSSTVSEKILSAVVVNSALLLAMLRRLYDRLS